MSMSRTWMAVWAVVAMTACGGPSGARNDTEPDSDDEVYVPDSDSDSLGEPDTDVAFTFPAVDCSAPAYALPPEDADRSDDLIDCDAPDRVAGSNCRTAEGLCIWPAAFAPREHHSASVREDVAQFLVTARCETSKAVGATEDGRYVVQAYWNEGDLEGSTHVYDLCTDEMVGSYQKPVDYEYAEGDPDPTDLLPECTQGVWSGPEALADVVMSTVGRLNDMYLACHGTDAPNLCATCQCNVNAWLPELPDVCLRD